MCMHTLYHTPSSLRGLYLDWKIEDSDGQLGVHVLKLPIYKHTLIKFIHNLDKYIHVIHNIS